ncbi:hypothetical protein O5D80_007251 [Batrachochytrium dendrobatidis]|nr:hypothetical protein O5D80_007251 [Batrachochytrium dendrobatidis]
MAKRTASGKTKTLAQTHLSELEHDRTKDTTATHDVALQAKPRPKTTKVVVSNHIWQYMLVQIDFANPADQPANFDEAIFKNIIVVSLRKTYGIVGAAISVSLLHFESGRSCIRVPFEQAAVVSSALALCLEYDGASCRIQVIEQSPFLCSLAFHPV